jgi:hypothetical protein
MRYKIHNNSTIVLRQICGEYYISPGKMQGYSINYAPAIEYKYKGFWCECEWDGDHEIIFEDLLCHYDDTQTRNRQ